MIALFCREDCLAADVLRLLTDLPVRWAKGRDGFHELLNSSHGGLVVVPDLGDADHRSWVRHTIETFSHVAWLLLTDPKPENTVHLVELDPRVRVVWLDEMRSRLQTVAREITRTDLLDLLIRMVGGAPGMPPDLARVLMEIGESRHPPRTVAGLSLSTGLPERRLRYQWAREGAPDRSLKELVDWMVLGWALRRKRRLGSWERVAAELGMKAVTLRALSIRRTGMTLDRLERTGRDG